MPGILANVRLIALIARLVVVSLSGLVYGAQALAADSLDDKLETENRKLPGHVADTRDQLLAAVRAASLDELASIAEASHVRTDFGREHRGDARAALKALSADGRGHDVLAALADCLDVAPATLPLGRDLENNLIYVWPYLAEKPIDQLTPHDEIALYRLVPVAKVAEMREKKRWLWWRVAIAADGSLIAFTIDR